MRVHDLFLKSIEFLKGTDTPKLDARVLLSHHLNVDSNSLFAYFNDETNEHEFYKLLNRRICGEPVANIIGKKPFWDSVFFVNSDVLTPRPDSETLIRAVIDNYECDDVLTILDLGTGSGCLMLTLLGIYRNASGVGTDISEKALEIARQNGSNFKNVEFIKSNWNDSVSGNFDIIVSNPPYIATNAIHALPPEVSIYNPLLALDGGEDGLDHYEYLAKNLKKNMYKDTKIFLEIGMGQERGVIEKFANFNLHKTYKDLNNIVRVVSFCVR